MLTFKFSGADGVMTVAETLTSGMVGKQVKLEFTSDWNNLTKTAVFEAGDISEAVYDVSDTATIPEAVLSIPRRRLKIGIYGEDAKGNVTPTIYATGPRIEEGADPWRAAAGEPPMPKWKELEERIENLENGATGGGSGSDSGQNVTLTTAQINALDGMFKVCAYDDSKPMAAAYVAFKTAFGITDSGEEEPDIPVEPDEPVVPEVTLTSISAVYSGGDVPVGTAVADLTGIVVTAHYSDGTSETVAGYTLSGTIVEGSNTVTVSYGGKTATFTVSGVAESGGEDEGETPEILYELAEPTTFDGTKSIDTGWSPLAEDKDFTIAGKVVTVMTEGSIASVRKYIYPNGAYGLGIANELACTIAISTSVASTQSIVRGEGSCEINNFVITHAKGSDVCNVALYYERIGGNARTKYEEIPFPVVPEIAETMVLASGFTGTINDFKIYSRVFTDDEIEAYIA